MPTSDGDLEALVAMRLRGPGPRWMDGLAPHLARREWSALDLVGLNRGNYGTGRFVQGDPGATRDVEGVVRWPASSRIGATTIVERLHDPSLRRYADLGLRLHGPGELAPARAIAALEGAFSRLAEVPGAAAAIGTLVAVIHVVRPDGPEYDVSYSDPDVPFSVFVGIDAAEQAHRDLRLAEGILHECMHLQLTLIERSVPLVAGARDLFHSPWTGTLRPIQGVVHAIYVFRAIQDFCRALLDAGKCEGGERRYLERRLATIDDEVASTADIRASSDLTDAGRELVAGLLG